MKSREKCFSDPDHESVPFPIIINVKDEFHIWIMDLQSVIRPTFTLGPSGLRPSSVGRYESLSRTLYHKRRRRRLNFGGAVKLQNGAVNANEIFQGRPRASKTPLVDRILDRV